MYARLYGVCTPFRVYVHLLGCMYTSWGDCTPLGVYVHLLRCMYTSLGVFTPLGVYVHLLGCMYTSYTVCIYGVCTPFFTRRWLVAYRFQRNTTESLVAYRFTYIYYIYHTLYI